MKGVNVTFDVKFRNFESVTKKSSEILADEDIFFGKSHIEKCHLRNLS